LLKCLVGLQERPERRRFNNRRKSVVPIANFGDRQDHSSMASDESAISGELSLFSCGALTAHCKVFVTGGPHVRCEGGMLQRI
jgi:hypothetical protein